jgi:hypothetical protein
VSTYAYSLPVPFLLLAILLLLCMCGRVLALDDLPHGFRHRCNACVRNGRQTATRGSPCVVPPRNAVPPHRGPSLSCGPDKIYISRGIRQGDVIDLFHPPDHTSSHGPFSDLEFSAEVAKCISKWENWPHPILILPGRY